MVGFLFRGLFLWFIITIVFNNLLHRLDELPMVLAIPPAALIAGLWQGSVNERHAARSAEIQDKIRRGVCLTCDNKGWIYDPGLHTQYRVFWPRWDPCKSCNKNNWRRLPPPRR
jgi:hypothetical protein